jgi:hypothetical protein
VSPSQLTGDNAPFMKVRSESRTSRQPINDRDLEALRDITFRRRPDLRLRDVPSILRFVDRVGFAFLYRAGSELPSVWGAVAGRRNPVLPRHTHQDEGVGLAWEAKDVLAARRKIFYGKLIHGSPTLVSLELFPAFYALSGNRGEDGDHLRWAREGLLGHAARRIIEVLIRNPPLTTADLKVQSGFSGSRRRYAFDKAMAELQGKLLVVKYAELYDPKFTFIWGPLHRWLHGPIERARELAPLEARAAILRKHLETKWAVEADEVEKLFGWARPAVREAFAALAAEGFLEERPAGSRDRTVLARRGIDRAITRLRR